MIETDRVRNAVVLSVNVGPPREIAWNGTVVTTAFRKAPVAGRIPILGTMLRGDAQADRDVHGGERKAVFVYPFEHYEHWRAWLGEAASFGMFGENLTTSGVLEDSVALGDRFRVGGAELEVAGPRQPCYKVDVGLDRRGAAAEMTRSGRIGFYLGLLRPGSIEAGDTLEFLGGPERDRVSPATLHRLNTAATPDDLDLLEEVARSPHLPEGWARSLRTKAAGLRRRRQRIRPTAWRGVRDFVVTQTVSEAPGVVSLHLEPADTDPLPTVLPGQFISIVLPPDDVTPDGIARSYTVSGIEATTWRITVRRSGGSRGGSERVHRLSPGDVVAVRAPAGDFVLDDRRPDAPTILLSAGIGITPSLPLAKAHARRGSAPLVVVHAMRTASDNALVMELADATAAVPHGDLRLCVSDGTTSDIVPPTEQVGTRLTFELLSELVSTHASTGRAYLCGPPGFVASLRQRLLDLGFEADRVHGEEFLSPSDDLLPVAVPVGGLEVSFAQHGQTHLWSDPDLSLLDLADDAGVVIPASCRQGVCGTCATTVLDGEVAYRQSPVAPVPANACLPCVAVPRTRLRLDA